MFCMLCLIICSNMCIKLYLFKDTAKVKKKFETTKRKRKNNENVNETRKAVNDVSTTVNYIRKRHTFVLSYFRTFVLFDVFYMKIRSDDLVIGD